MASSQESSKMEEEGGRVTEGRPIHCLNNCGFFGSVTTMNLCSKCYRELNAKANTTTTLTATPTPASAPAPDLNTQPLLISSTSKSSCLNLPHSPQDGVVTSKVVSTSTAAEPAFSPIKSNCLNLPHYPHISGATLAVAGTSSITSVEPEAEVAETLARKRSNRCYSCNKRVGLTGFTCRCGDMFCALHRYSDMHACNFDYKAAGRLAISKANPLVKASKIDKI